MIIRVTIFSLLLWLAWAGAALAQSPVITVTITSADTAPGEFFLTPAGSPFRFASTRTAVLINNHGTVTWQQEHEWIDFKRQLNFYTVIDLVNARALAMDGRFSVVDEWQAVGYNIDVHEFQLLPNGDVWYLIYNPRAPTPAEISAGVAPTATVISSMVQAQDAEKNVFFEWTDLDHLPITGTLIADLGESFVDAYHANSIDFDFDGHVLVSFRNRCSVVKINRFTGAVIWRLGGINSDFTGNVNFCTQHDFRPATLSRFSNNLEQAYYTVFDNTGARGLKIELNQVSMVATETMAYTNNLPIYAFATGSTQELENGNVLVSWGTNPNLGPDFGEPVSRVAFTEFTADGRKAFEAEIGSYDFSYRVYKFKPLSIYWLPALWK